MNIFLLQHLLTSTAKKYPKNLAVVFKQQSITYEDLEKKTNQIAWALFELGVKKGDRVGIILSKSIESIIALFSILKTGASYVPIDSSGPVCRADYIISNCEIECLLTSEEKAAKVLPNLSHNSPLKKVLISDELTKAFAEKHSTLELLSWEDIFKMEPKGLLTADITDTYPAYILYTSGSTGSPKGVVISHLNALTFINIAADFFGINKNDKLCSHAPLHFDLSVFDIFVAVKCGSTIVLIPEFCSTFPMKLAEYIDQKKISVWNSVSSVLSLLAERSKLERFRFDDLRLVIFSGEILPVKYLRKIRTHMQKAQFFNLYGQTEANSSTFYQIKELPDHDAWKIPIGKPFANYEVFALNEANEIINSPEVEGELFIRGSSVAMGYWGKSEQTAKSFVQDPLQPFSSNRVYKTGDIVSMDQDGNYLFIGRKDNLIKSRGYRIDLEEIEVTLYSYAGIKQAAVITLPDDLIGNRIIAYVSPAEGIKLEKKEIINHCAKFIPQYMLPEIIEFHSDLPKTSTGKIDRKSLKANTCFANQPGE